MTASNDCEKEGQALNPKQKIETETEEDGPGRRFSPGGTPGGTGMFLFGLALAIAGGYLIMNQI